ncbi:unnamed protein product [Arctogadus glacialis]
MPKVSEPLRGISLPVGNDTEEIHASACAVRAYLGDHLPQIIKEFFKPSQCLALIERVKEIANQLSEIPEIGVPQHTNRCQCHLDYKEPKAKYQRKTMGLRILHNVNHRQQSPDSDGEAAAACEPVGSHAPTPHCLFESEDSSV